MENRTKYSTGKLLPILLALLVVAILVMVANIVRSCGSQQEPTTSNEPLQVSDTQVATNSEKIVLTLLGGPETIVKRGEEYVEPGCQAIDSEEGPITASVQTSGSVDTSKAGDYRITYMATNSKGESAMASRTVHVVDSLDAAIGISVMMYHYVFTSDDPPSSSDTNYLNATKLEEQLKWLTENGYYYPSYAELRAWLDGTHTLPAKSVVLTFDDGQIGFLKYGIPLLEKYQVPATSFVIGDRKETPEKVRTYASPYVTFQSHSYSLHNGGNTNIGRGGRIYDLTQAQLTEDERKMGEILGSYQAFAYPYGDVSDAAPAALRDAGVQCAFTIEYGQVHPGDDPMKLKRVRVFGEGALEGYKAQVQNGS